jgi:hypothetical protein
MDPLTCHDVAPLWTVSGASGYLRRPDEEVRRWIENGRLEWAWDIGRPGSRRREIRVWYRSLEVCKGRRPASTLSPETVVAAIIGHNRPALRVSEVCAILNCNRNLVRRLLESGELLSYGTAQRSCQSQLRRLPLVARASLENFLRRRRLF